MAHPARAAVHRTRSAILAAVVVTALAGLLADRSPASSSSPSPSASSAASRIAVSPGERSGALGQADGVVPGGTTVLRREHRGALGEADGVVPGGTTVFDDEYPGVANLDPGLLGALRRAATDAAEEGVVLFVDSGWRSPEYQEQLLMQAVATYGSAAQAAEWVATPSTSAHVSGDAVDIGHADATAWLARHGAAYGLCQIYRNEPWHYELRPDAAVDGCPPMYANPTDDPRMRH